MIRHARLFAVVTSLTSLVVPVVQPGRSGAASPGTWGVERWSGKTGTDPDAPSVDQSHVSPTTVGYLDGLAAPADRPGNARVRPVETSVFSVTATLTDYVLEDDSDYHLVLRDAQGRTMIVEIPEPACVGDTSPFRGAITQARADFDGRLAATTSFKTANVAVRV